MPRIGFAKSKISFRSLSEIMLNNSYGMATFNPTSGVLTDSNWELKPLLEFSKEEYDRCVLACSVLDAFKNDAQLFRIVIWNHEDYCALYEQCLNAYIHKSFESFSIRQPDLNLNRCLMNLLSSIRSYLDYVELNVKRRYGASSANAVGFLGNCSLEYDRRFSYRFLYRLRNFAQHCGLPLTIVNFNSAEEAKSGNVQHSLEVGIARDDLLSRGFDWGAVKPDILAQPEIIIVNPHVEEVMACLTHIHSQYLADEFVELRESATYLKTLIDKIPSSVDELHLFGFPPPLSTDTPQQTRFRMQIVPLDVINDAF